MTLYVGRGTSRSFANLGQFTHWTLVTSDRRLVYVSNGSTRHVRG
jgi:hypothetical protein